MEDTDVRAALRGYVSDAPPVTVTSAQILTQGRRQRRLRQIGWAGGSAMTALAVFGAVMAGPALLSATSTGTVPGAGVALSASAAAPSTAAKTSWATLDPAPFCAVGSAPPTSPDQPPATRTNSKAGGFTIVQPTEPVDHAAARFSCYLMGEVPRHLPGATFLRDGRTPSDSVPFQGFESRSRAVADQEITSAAVITDAKGIGSLSFIMLPRYSSDEDAKANCVNQTGCVVRSGPHGELVIVKENKPYGRGYQNLNIDVWHGATIVMVVADNADPRQPVPAASLYDGPGPVVGRPDLPLSVDTLIAIAASPELTLFP